MFTSLAHGNVNIEMISQGASEVNISCVIQGRDAVKALNLIHQSCLQIKVEERRGRGEQSAMSTLIENQANRFSGAAQLGRGYFEPDSQVRGLRFSSSVGWEDYIIEVGVVLLYLEHQNARWTGKRLSCAEK